MGFARAPRAPWTRGYLPGALLVFGLLGPTCRRSAPQPPVSTASVPLVGPVSCPPVVMNPPAPSHTDPDPRPLRRCFEALPAWSESPVNNLLDKAGTFLDDGDFEGALACAEESARQMPRSVEAHNDRALALSHLSRLDEARDALTLSLALAPNDAETLELAADLYINELPPSAERATIGLEYARRGAQRAKEKTRLARLSLLEGQALIDLGRATEALSPLTNAVRLAPEDAANVYEKGVALFELCRFHEAQVAFQRVLTLEPSHAHARYHLGLIYERNSDESNARDSFAWASRLEPKAFPPSPEVTPAEFLRRVRQTMSRLPDDIQADLRGIPVDTADLPAVEDLTAERPPLSPTILGLYRGLPLGREEPDEQVRLGASAIIRAGRGRPVHASGLSVAASPASRVFPERGIVLYRRNLLRSLQSLDELDKAIERTLLHEVGHLRGEDDGSLRDRGLE